MTNHRYQDLHRPARAAMAVAIATLLAALASVPAQAQYVDDASVESNDSGWLYDSGSVISIFVDAPLEEPEPVAIGWAPPPMLVEEIPPPPDRDAVWTGGYWTWQGDWVWCAGRWMMPPRPQYVWVQPYYEHRDERVIFLPSYWSRPDVEFVAPSYDRPIAWAYVGANVVVGPPPMGPSGIFIPPPPGSRPGIIIPAPVGTPPAVVVSAPPVMNVGMSVHGNVNINSHNTVVNDNRVTNYNVTNVRNVTNVVIQAPAGAMANGRAFEATVPHQAHLAAAQKPVVPVRAPAPVSRTAVQAYVPGRTVAALPPPQHVQGLPTVPSHPVAVLTQAQRGQMAHAPIVPLPHGVSLAPEQGLKPTSTAGPVPIRPEQGKPGDIARARVPQAGQPQPPDLQIAEQQRQHAQQAEVQRRAQEDEQARQHAQQQAEQQRVQAARAHQTQQPQRAPAEEARQREPQQAQPTRALVEARTQQAQQQQRAQEEAQAQQREQQQTQQQRGQAQARAQQAQQQQRAQVEEQARLRAQQTPQMPRPAEPEVRGRVIPHASAPANGRQATEEERIRQGQGSR